MARRRKGRAEDRGPSTSPKTEDRAPIPSTDPEHRTSSTEDRAPSPSPSTSPSPSPSTSPSPSPSPSTSPRLRLVASGALILLALLAGPAPAHPWPVLIDLGRLLVGLAALLAIVPLIPRAPARLANASTIGAPLVALVALMALTGRSDLPGRAFDAAHPATLGLPSELAFVALTIGLARGSRLLTALGLGWATLSLATPDVTLARLVWPFEHASPVVTAGAIALALVTLAGWVVTLGPRALRGHASLLRLATRAAPIAGVLLALGTLAADPHPLPGLLVAALVGLLPALVLAVPSSPDTPRARLALGLELTLGAIVIGLWLLLKSHALIPSNTDENIYFYMAELVASGRMPYADFFFAHPPLHILVPGLFFAVFGWSLTLAKLFALVASLVTGIGLWLIARRGSAPRGTLPDALSRATGLLAMILFLFAAEPLKASSNMTGVNMTTAWLVMGALAHVRGRPLAAGLCLGAAATTGFYAMAAVMALLALALFHPPGQPGFARPSGKLRAHARRLRFFLVQLAGFALVFGVVNLVFWAIGGDAFLEGVYDYHQKKTFEDPAMVELLGGPIAFPASLFHNLSVMSAGKDLTKEVFYHPHLWLAALALPVLALGRWIAQKGKLLSFFDPRRLARDADGLAATMWLVGLALFLEFAMFRELYSFYFTLIYPFLAFACAAVVTGAVRTIADAVGAARRGWREHAGVLAALGAALILALHPPLAWSTQAVFDDELAVVGERNQYTWTPGPLGAVSEVVRPLFWSDHRIKGDVEPGYRHFLWSKKRGFSTLDAIAAFVAERTRPDETIAGASTMAPLVALAAGRRIAADEVDTNNKRFRTGLLSEEAYWTAICADDVKLILSLSRSYFTSERMESLPTAKRHFRLARVFEDDELLYRGALRIAIYERVGEARCQWER
ncbi:MAG: hypothetical protein IT385_21590 [Deltaproteobacteria bacterium]|nr:hypothetical protein [Deltaproteobacteria bacterium]